MNSQRPCDPICKQQQNVRSQPKLASHSSSVEQIPISAPYVVRGMLRSRERRWTPVGEPDAEAADPVPTEESTTLSPLPPPAPPVTEESVGPIRRGKKTPVQIIHHQYEKALKEVNDGSLIAVPLKAPFYKQEALAELKIHTLSSFQN